MSATLNVLFVCSANAARSIMAEAILRHVAPRRFVAYSAGSCPAACVHPRALAILERFQIPGEGLRPKSWDVFTGPEAPCLDFVFTLCDRAAGETCPTWRGQPLGAHWGIADPVVNDADADEFVAVQRFRIAFAALERRIGLFVNLPLASLEGLRLQAALDDIGRA